jgi:hypothetical protein
VYRFPDIVAPCLGIHPVQGDPRGKQRAANPEVILSTFVLPYIFQ